MEDEKINQPILPELAESARLKRAGSQKILFSSKPFQYPISEGIADPSVT